MAFDIATPGTGDTVGRTLVGDWPFLGDDNYVEVTPEYTRLLVDKLANSDADVAAAVNAAAEATAAAAALGATHYVVMSADTAITTSLGDLGSLTTTITVGGPAEKWAIDLHIDLWQSGTAGTTVAMVYVDNEARSAQLIASIAAGQRIPLHGRYYVTGLTAGQHTIKARAQVLSGAALAQKQHSYIIAERIR